jgi:hypothetical protein
MFVIGNPGKIVLFKALDCFLEGWSNLKKLAKKKNKYDLINTYDILRTLRYIMDELVFSALFFFCLFFLIINFIWRVIMFSPFV